MSEEKIAKYSPYLRPLLFAAVLLLHVAAIYLFNFSVRKDDLKKSEPDEEEVFKLVDIQEYLPPPPQPEIKKEPVPEPPKPPKTQEPPPAEKDTLVVPEQPKAAEKIVETAEKVQEEQKEQSSDDSGEITYLPQHKISSVPVIPSKEVISRIVYPQMALKQGIEAVVYLELFIDSRGVIRKIKVLKDPGYGFAQSAVKAFEGLSCIPASANGKNCAVRYRYPVKFTLN